MKSNEMNCKKASESSQMLYWRVRPYSSDSSNRDGDKDQVHRLCIGLDSSSTLVTLEFPNVVDVASDSIDGSVGMLANEVLGKLLLERLLEDGCADSDTEDASSSSVTRYASQSSVCPQFTLLLSLTGRGMRHR